MVRQTAAMVENGIVAFESDSDLEMLEKAFPANIKLLEALLINSPSDTRLLSLLSRLYASYCFSFTETKLDQSRAIKKNHCSKKRCAKALKTKVNLYYQKGIQYGVRALESRHPGAEIKLKKNHTIGPFLQKLDKNDVSALFWYGFNLGAWVNRNFDSIRAVSKAHVVRKVMERVIELDEGYFYGSSHLFLLAYHASRSPLLGGRPELAQLHYHHLKKIAGADFMLADLFYAKYYLHQVQEKDQYAKVLKKIMQPDKKSSEKYTLFNKVASQRAAIYLEDMDRLFE